MPRLSLFLPLLLALSLPTAYAQDPEAPAPENRPVPQEGYTAEEIVSVGANFFGGTTEGLARFDGSRFVVVTDPGPGANLRSANPCTLLFPHYW